MCELEKVFISSILQMEVVFGSVFNDYNFEKYKNTVVTIAEGMDVQIGKCVSFLKETLWIAFLIQLY
ncbi:hypothetical protein [Lactovum miscens]|uniref:Uncharacterized protein n=1 Tax=Lactovum miscens TaxID=190387 RepID=A0A841C755_9LACT|nr:hypothetical protein [Lactovum miscens]MBB5888127.1 hypothetical protein [Lactovum miscens]